MTSLRVRRTVTQMRWTASKYVGTTESMIAWMTRNNAIFHFPSFNALNFYASVYSFDTNNLELQQLRESNLMEWFRRVALNGVMFTNTHHSDMYGMDFHLNWGEHFISLSLFPPRKMCAHKFRVAFSSDPAWYVVAHEYKWNTRKNLTIPLNTKTLQISVRSVAFFTLLALRVSYTYCELHLFHPHVVCRAYMLGMHMDLDRYKMSNFVCVWTWFTYLGKSNVISWKIECDFEGDKQRTFSSAGTQSKCSMDTSSSYYVQLVRLYSLPDLGYCKRNSSN